MIPSWGLGLCYAARLFENQAGLIEIAEGLRNEGIPCDMLGWEEHYYQMKWVWNRDMFPNPRIMIDKLHEMGYAFELWESGDAPTTGYMNSKNRKKWFDERIASSLGIGVDFFKQDESLIKEKTQRLEALGVSLGEAYERWEALEDRA